MSERKVQELQDLEEGAESVHKPMLILFSDASLNVITVEKDLRQGWYSLG